MRIFEAGNPDVDLRVGEFCFTGNFVQLSDSDPQEVHDFINNLRDSEFFGQPREMIPSRASAEWAGFDKTHRLELQRLGVENF